MCVQQVNNGSIGWEDPRVDARIFQVARKLLECVFIFPTPTLRGFFTEGDVTGTN